MTPRFFIDRPIFAWVVALCILLAGVLTLRVLPIEQYPSVAPPSLVIGVTYPGADAETLEKNVTQIIEQELNGVKGLLYLSSTSLSNGTGTITATFEAGTDIDMAQVQVQNRLTLVEPRLPDEVRRQGMPIQQGSYGAFMMVIALSSKSGRASTDEVADFAHARLLDELRRVPGVGDVRIFEPPYAMRVWLDPQKLAHYRLSASEVLAAVQEQNSQSPGGQIGAMPSTGEIDLNAGILTQSRFSTPEQFARVILRANPDGSAVTLGDVARVGLGPQTYGYDVEFNGKPVAGIAISLTPGANALATVSRIKARMAELAETFPEDYAWSAPYDLTPFIEASIGEVAKTLAEAMGLVFLVMFLFLQNWRATLIPTIVVPIALAGACLGLWVIGSSINVLSMFGMVLGIGILVDDAIVVIENVERIMAAEGLSPREATVKAMRQITSAIVGMTLVLMAVFVPMAFFPGSTGAIYRQFSVTLIVSIGFSALLALTLTPALCATFLRPHAVAGSVDGALATTGPGRVAVAFNRWFSRTTDAYRRHVGAMLGRPLRWLAVFAAMVGLTLLLYARLPGGFLPTEDQGTLLTVVQAPAGATRDRTNNSVRQVVEFYKGETTIENMVVVRGFSFFGQGQANAMMMLSLKPWEDRPGKENSSLTLAGRAMARFASIKEGLVFAFTLPPILELGTASGFSFKLQDIGGRGHHALVAARNQLLGMASQSPVLVGVRPEGQEDAPHLRVLIDRIQARALGVSIGDVNTTLAIAFGSYYANDFNFEGRVLRVMLQADAPYRMTPDDVLELRVHNAAGEMVPFGAFTRVEWTSGPQQLQRYNGYPAMTIAGMAAPGRSTGEAMAEMERLAQQLPAGFSFAWTGISYEEQQLAGQDTLLLGLSLVIVFLVLAALYESWSIPVAVLLVVPLGILGSILFTMLRGMSADIYFNVGLITIIGLAAKNAILIVQFAIGAEAAGKSTLEATLEAVKLRLRPIIMTSLAFIGGMVPLVIATGAGAASRAAVGTGVMGGMILATLLGIFFIPVFYLVVRRWVARGRVRAAEVPPDDDPGATHA